MPIGRHSESTEGQLKLSNSDLLDPATPFRRDGEVARASGNGVRRGFCIDSQHASESLADRHSDDLAADGGQSFDVGGRS